MVKMSSVDQESYKSILNKEKKSELVCKFCNTKYVINEEILKAIVQSL